MLLQFAKYMQSICDWSTYVSSR